VVDDQLALVGVVTQRQYTADHFAFERIRDKVAASKRKGIWMGTKPPLSEGSLSAASNSAACGS
jgi:hypothetical protein